MFPKNPKVVQKDLHAEQWNKLILANFSAAGAFFANFLLREKKVSCTIWDWCRVNWLVRRPKKLKTENSEESMRRFPAFGVRLRGPPYEIMLRISGSAAISQGKYRNTVTKFVLSF